MNSDKEVSSTEAEVETISPHEEEGFQWKDQLPIQTFFQRVMSFENSSDNGEPMKLEGIFALEDEDGDTIVADVSRDVLNTLGQSLRQVEESGQFFFRYKQVFDGSVRELPVDKIRLQTFSSSPSESMLKENLEYAVELLSPILSPSYQFDEERLVAESSNTARVTGTLMISPFADVNTSSAVLNAQQTAMVWKNQPLNRESVEGVLDGVRPYMIADGGNVALVDIDEDNLVVKLALQGACSSCASSTVSGCQMCRSLPR
jgi:Fe-S cluster biogenesis protein NfuA